MARGLNKVLLIGIVGRNPEMRYTPNGRAVTTFSIAVGYNWTSAEGERHEKTEWFNIVAWDDLAELCNARLSANMQVYVEGRLQTRGWEDAEGKKHFRTEVVANKMLQLGDRLPLSDDEDTFSGDEEDYSF